MKCPFCGLQNRDHVLETRTLNDGVAIKRRLFVVKSDNRRVPFDRNKIVRRMQLVCTGRDIRIKTLEEAAQDIECNATILQCFPVYTRRWRNSGSADFVWQ